MNDHTHDHAEHGHGAEHTHAAEWQAPAGASTQAITVQKRAFIGPAPYAAGHVLNETEALALNQTYGENLRNNFSSRMKKAAKHGKTLLQEDFWAYAQNYSFGVRQPRTVMKDPVAVQERKLAIAAVRKAIKDKGVAPKSIAPDTFLAYVEQTLANQTFRKQAEAMVAAQTPVHLNLRIGSGAGLGTGWTAPSPIQSPACVWEPGQLFALLSWLFFLPL